VLNFINAIIEVAKDYKEGNISNIMLDFSIYGFELMWTRFQKFISTNLLFQIKNEGRNRINGAINRAMIYSGRACTKCFSRVDVVPDEFQLKDSKNLQSYSMPNDEFNYKTLIIPDKDFPLFRLCDNCNKNISQSEIKNLKRVAFNKDNTMGFSMEFIEKIEGRDFSEIYI
jgi:hypothetical protein